MIEQPNGVDITVPLRSDGKPKRFWYDREYPRHIVHHEGDGICRLICIGHDD